MFWYPLLINVGFTALRTPFCWWLLLGKILIPDIWWGSPSPSCPDRSRFRPWCNHCAAKFWRSFGGTTWHGIYFTCTADAVFTLLLLKIVMPYPPIILPGIHCLQMKALKDLGLDVTKGSVTTDSAVTQTKFHIMRSWVLCPFLFYFRVQHLVMCVYVENKREHLRFLHICIYIHF
jgi:hypothetical protein